MSGFRRGGGGRRRDGNEPDVVDAFNALGWVVFRIGATGLPDLLVTRRGIWKPVEVKQPGKSLTPEQEATRRIAYFDVVEGAADVHGLAWTS